MGDRIGEQRVGRVKGADELAEQLEADHRCLVFTDPNRERCSQINRGTPALGTPPELTEDSEK